MIDVEVEELRRLRRLALRVRAIARTSSDSVSADLQPVLQRSACAAWRVARVVTGRLRSHPLRRFRRDAGVIEHFQVSVITLLGRVFGGNRQQLLGRCALQMRSLMRRLSDLRSLTRDADLGAAFGRLQRECRELLDTLNASQRLIIPTRASAVHRPQVHVAARIV